jgi:hypothetical protein
MNELNEHDLPLIMEALQVYKVSQTWWTGHEEIINNLMTKIQDIQNNYDKY